MDTKILYKLFSNSNFSNSNNFFFLHGNGFPPEAYNAFLDTLSHNGDVFAMYQKPFSPTNIDPSSIYGWDIFKNDAINFIEQKSLKNSIAIGHSMGAVLILMIEIQRPGTFKHIFLLDPVITSWFKSLLYRILLKFQLIDRLHPMIQKTNNKKMIYKNKEDLYTSYRAKNIFSRINDSNLKEYINSIIENKDGKVSIKLSKSWENTIYRNGSLYDYMIWRKIKSIKVPTYIITPKDDEFGHFNYGNQLKKKNQNFINLSMENATHLFPLEYPKQTVELITSNINS